MRVRPSFTLVTCLCVTVMWGQSKGLDRLYVFGDSHSDVGEGYLDGNGPTAVAYLAKRLGLVLARSNAPNSSDQSLDFAVSGAQTGRGPGRKVDTALLGYGMQNQVDDFAARVSSGDIKFNSKTTLFFLAGGLNDGRLANQTTIKNLEEEMKRLYASGARNFALALLPTAIPGFSAVGQRLNPELAKIPDEMAPQLPDAHILLCLWGPFFDDVMNHAAKYGITNTKDACAGRQLFHQDATPCPTPETYFYYHAEHPSTAVHKVVGDKLYDELTQQGAGR
ncbi:MAG: SGNH/GDSL hydrolase family protein [Bryobacteraceae bacterium]